MLQWILSSEQMKQCWFMTHHSSPSKCFIPTVSASVRRRTKQAMESVLRRRVITSPSHQSARFHTEKHWARSQEQAYHGCYLLIRGARAWQICTVPVRVPRIGGLFRGTRSLGSPGTTKPSGRAQSASDASGLRGEAPARLCNGHSWWCGLPSAVPCRQQERRLLCLLILSHPLLVSLLSCLERKKGGKKVSPSQATDLAKLPSKPPARAGSFRNEKNEIFAC